MASKLPVIIVGAGVVGLTLAQSLQKEGIPFEIYERGTHIERAKGWGITIHWALPALKVCLPPAMYERLSTIQVDPEEGRRNNGRFVFLDLSTAEARYEIPPSERLRINRLKFRSLLAEGLDVNWGKQISGFDSLGDCVQVKFTDGTLTKGSLLVGADGSGSRTRRLLVGDEVGKLYQLPVRFIGVTIRLTPGEVKPLRDIDPLLFQGCHPDTGAYLWYSTLSTPEVNGSNGIDEYYEGQLNMSWIVKSPADEVPASNSEKITRMKDMARGFESRLKQIIEKIPQDAEVIEIKLQDWPTLSWPTYNGRVTLVGDAAHAMTMYRGEAANHGITDAARLTEQLQDVGRGMIPQREAVIKYESEMRPRAHDAVLLSRQACLDAHDLNSLTPDSPLVSKRAKVRQPGVAVKAGTIEGQAG
ncbi:putative FAD-dependent monooxygenase [Lachnellula occidentalis]|uniref:Putative FAD-dependent monooxygenase n=1 Tax=Lachnellula occidentalis TaxID=215460 RepID=A0A8H8RP63_9HELO|nr:putative FAD-dependent monooxygenase [Lachnellula occidentalis]